jgi:hypothetical protein
MAGGPGRGGLARAAAAPLLPALLALVALVAAPSRVEAAAVAVRARSRAPSPFDQYASLSSRPPVAAVVAEARKRALNPYLDDPLNTVIFTDPAVERSAYLRTIRDMLRSAINRESVQWLDSTDKRDRDTLAHIFLYCQNVFASRGTDRDCVVMCHPRVDCGLQAARECVTYKARYEEYIQCTDAEQKFCAKFGQFNGEKFPSFRPRGDTEEEKLESLVEYCGNMLQFRGVKLPCLRDCTIFQMRQKTPDQYFAWRARQRFESGRRVGRGGAFRDPSEPDEDPERGMLECEKEGLRLCQHIQRSFWRECYERVKLQCMQRIGEWNYLVAH